MLDELRRSDPTVPYAGTSVLLGSRLAWLLLALGSAGWLAWRVLDSSRVTPVAPLAAQSVDQVRTPVDSTVPTAREERAELNTTLEADVPWRIAARVLLPDSSPVVGHPVRLHFSGDDAPEPLQRRTDEEGQVVFEVPRDSKLRHIVALTTDKLVSKSQWLRGRRSGGGDQDLTLIVGPGGTISGVVLDEHDQPVPGARVRGWCGYIKGEPHRSVRADEQGRFTVEHLGSRFHLIAETDDKVRARGLFGTLRHEQFEANLELRVAPAVTWQGEVHDPEGRPVQGAEVHVGNGANTYGDNNRVAEGVHWFRAGSCRTESDAEGRFQLDGLPPRNIYLEVNQAPYLAHRKWHDEGRGPLTVVLDPGLRLKGEITSSSGTPAQGARVRFYPFYSNVHNAPLWTEADEEGRFEIAGMSRPPSMERDGYIDSQPDRNPPTIVVVAPGHAVRVMQPLRPSETGLPAVAVLLEAERHIRGRVVDEAGQPMADVLVRIEGDRTFERGMSDGRTWTWERAGEKDECRTAEDGSFAFDSLYEGTFAVRAHALQDDQLFVEKRCSLIGPDMEASAELVLTRTAVRQVVVKGRVIDAHTSKPIENFKVIPYHEKSGRHYLFTDPAGRFEVVGLAPGAWEVDVQAPGYVRWSSEERYLERGEHEFDVELIPCRNLTLRLVDGFGDRIEADASVQVLDVSGQVITLYVPIGGGSYSHESMLHADQGEIRLPNLPRAPLTLRVLHDFRRTDHPIDLRTWNEEAFEVVVSTLERRSIQLSFLEAGDELQADEGEVERHWNRARTSEESRAWITERFEDGRLRYPQHAFQVRIDVGAVEGVKRAEIEPKGEGFRIRERGLMARGSSFSDNDDLHFASIWASVPPRDHSIHIESAHYRQRTFTEDLELGEGTHRILVVLR